MLAVLPLRIISFVENLHAALWIARNCFASAEKCLNTLTKSGKNIKLKERRKETEHLNVEREVNYKGRYEREWIKAAGNIRKDAERIAEWNQQEDMKRDAPSL